MDTAPLAGISILLTAGLVWILSQGSIEAVKADWKNRRCELPVMFMGKLYKPSDDPRSGDDFASDNFDFCMRQTAKGIFKLFLAPVFMLIGKQMDMSFVVDNAINMMRLLLAQGMVSFNKIMDPFYRRFQMIGTRFALIFRRFMSAMERIFAIAVTSVYLGITAIVGIQNTIDFIIKVILIIMGVLVGIFILLFLILWPVAPIIITTIAVLASVGVGVAGASVFCFQADTEVMLQSGMTKPICQLEVGERLKDNGYIEGILLTKREETDQLYSYKGVIVSGSHLVWEDMTWKPVEEAHHALPIESTTSRLYSLRTSSRTMTVKSEGSEILFRDWEEISEGDETTDAEWDNLVQTMISQEVIPQETSDQDPMFSPHALVFTESGLTPLYTIKIGDTVAIDTDHKQFSRILGIYRGITHHPPRKQDSKWATDGVWWKEGENWVHRDHSPISSMVKTIGLHLITEHGCFWVETDEHSGIVRDFTEVGHLYLPKTMNFLLQRLNEKTKD